VPRRIVVFLRHKVALAGSKDRHGAAGRFLVGPWSGQPDRITPVPILIRAERRNINGSFYELVGVNPRG
jgi:hypothetical protein